MSSYKQLKDGDVIRNVNGEATAIVDTDPTHGAAGLKQVEEFLKILSPSEKDHLHKGFAGGLISGLVALFTLSPQKLIQALSGLGEGQKANRQTGSGIAGPEL